LAAYLLLTAPVDDESYGLVRNVLLVFTDALPYAVWLATIYVLEDDLARARWPRALKLFVAAFATWHVIFFGLLEGRGLYHEINHALAILVLAHAIWVALRGLGDDLVDVRRRARIVVAMLASAYGISLALVQLFADSLRDHPAFSLANAGLGFFAAFMLGRSLWASVPLEAADAIAVERADSSEEAPIPPEFAALKRNLDAFMDSGGYRQTNLTITRLANELECPEHRLRRLINGVLGFRNFSTFLNARRIQDAREQLAYPDQRTKPVLTIALELGYGSIGPFNRAFKAHTGQTPSEFRLSVQNRP
jgi:AraC-like DNA-binding protein